MMLRFSHVTITGQDLAITIERVSDGHFFNPSQSAFQTGLTYSQKKVNLAEGSAENLRSYTVDVPNVSGLNGLSDPGLVRIRVHDEGASNQTVDIVEAFIVGGAIVRPDVFTSTRATPVEVFNRIMTALTEVDGNIAELTELPSPNAPLGVMVKLLYMAIRNKSVSDGEMYRMFTSGGSPMFEADLEPSESDFTRKNLRKS